MVMQGGHDGSSRGMPDDALGFDDWSQCGHHRAMPGRSLPLPGREIWGRLGAREGVDGWRSNEEKVGVGY